MKIFSILVIIALIAISSTYASSFNQYDLLQGGISLFARNTQTAQLAKEFVKAAAEGETLSCLGCKAFFEVVKLIDEPILDYATNFLNNLSIQNCLVTYNETQAVCQAFADQSNPYIVNSTAKFLLNPDISCPFFNACPQVYEIIDIDALVADILKDTPPFKNSTRKEGAPTKKFLQLTDAHVDLEYLTGVPTTCQYPICCRNNTDPVVSKLLRQEQLSQYWGTQASCDLPLRTFQEFTDFVQRELSEEIDLMLWTGDNVAHDEENSELMRNFNTTQILSQIMQDKFQVPVIGSFGNNDASPDYIYDFKGDLDLDLQLKTAELWKGWIDEKAFQTLKDRGFFATRIPSVPNLKVINLNTFACSPKNYLLINDATDPGHQLEWLHQELAESETIGESVYLIGHIPISYCTENWGKVYKALVERYQNTVKGQIFGHTHSDQFSLLPSSRNKNLTIGVQYIAPSLTTNGGRNPSFRVFEVDAETYEILDYTQYRLNLGEANQLGPLASPLNWDIAYQFKQNYNLTSVSLDQLSSLAQNLASKNNIYDVLQMNYLTQYTLPTSYSKTLFCMTTAPQFEELAACKGSNPYPTNQTKFINSIEKNWLRKINSTQDSMKIKY